MYFEIPHSCLFRFFLCSGRIPVDSLWCSSFPTPSSLIISFVANSKPISSQLVLIHLRLLRTEQSRGIVFTIVRSLGRNLSSSVVSRSTSNMDMMNVPSDWSAEYSSNMNIGDEYVHHRTLV